MHRILAFRLVLVTTLMLIAIPFPSRLGADTGTCGGASITLPFTDVSASGFFCQIAQAYFSGLTNGTSATNYSPAANVTREQMAAFVTRTMDQALKRGSRRTGLKRFWTPTSPNGLGFTTVGSAPLGVESDGVDLWVANYVSGTVSRVRAGDGKLLEAWTGAETPTDVLAANGLIFVAGSSSTNGIVYQGILYQLDPRQPAGAVTMLTNSVQGIPTGIAFDGERIWTSNSFDGRAAVSIITLNPVGVTNIFAGSQANGILYDGANMWVVVGSNLYKLNSSGAIIQTVSVNAEGISAPAFDGTNIWVPNRAPNSVSVVRASTGTVLATLTGNGLDRPLAAVFDGERMLITNPSGNSVSLWKASDLSPLGSVSTGGLFTSPFRACSDGLNFWITLKDSNQLTRF